MAYPTAPINSTFGNVFISSGNDFAYFMSARVRWLHEQIMQLEQVKQLAQQKKKLQKKQQKQKPKPQVTERERRRSDQHCHQVSWTITLAEREFERRKRLQRRRAAWRIPIDNSGYYSSSRTRSSPLRAC